MFGGITKTTVVQQHTPFTVTTTLNIDNNNARQLSELNINVGAGGGGGGVLATTSANAIIIQQHQQLSQQMAGPPIPTGLEHLQQQLIPTLIHNHQQENLHHMTPLPTLPLPPPPPHQQQHQQHPQQHQQHQQQCNCFLPVLKPDVLLNNDRGLFKVYCFIKDFIGASGTSAVAIDNKIEQAMDLVKSHLMIAVREEVEVLKEKISELMDKINQLEVENTILKSNMSQETLQQLQMQTQLQIAGSTPTNGSNMLTAPPTPAAITAGPVATTPAVTAAAAVTTAADNIVGNIATAANSNNGTAVGTPQSNVGSGTATPTTQQPTATTGGSGEQNVENNTAIQNEEYQESAQSANGPMS